MIELEVGMGSLGCCMNSNTTHHLNSAHSCTQHQLRSALQDMHPCGAWWAHAVCWHHTHANHNRTTVTHAAHSQAGSNVWYQAYVIKESANEVKVRFPGVCLAVSKLLPTGSRGELAAVGCSRLEARCIHRLNVAHSPAPGTGCMRQMNAERSVVITSTEPVLHVRYRMWRLQV